MTLTCILALESYSEI